MRLLTLVSCFIAGCTQLPRETEPNYKFIVRAEPGTQVLWNDMELRSDTVYSTFSRVVFLEVRCGRSSHTRKVELTKGLSELTITFSTRSWPRERYVVCST
jgi:hypothetical protein